MARVTIVGGGYGGIAVAKALDEVAEVTLIEQKDRFVNHAAALRATVDPEWAEKIFIPYDNLLKNGRVIHGTVLKTNGTSVSVSGMDEEIEADHLVLATGTAYPFPAKHLESSAAIAKARIERAYNNLKQSGRVLIVGGGAVGIELAGEITSYFPEIEITLLESGPDILTSGDYKPELRESIRKQLQERGVKIMVGDSLSYLPPVDVGVLSPFRVMTQGGTQIKADMWFRAYGSSAATGYLGRDYAEVRHYDGTIRVDDHLRVLDHPCVWAIGDITDVRESKRADAARAHAEVVAANIAAMIRGEEPNAIYAPGKEWVVLPLGPNGGASQILKDGVRVVVGPEETVRLKGEDLFVDYARTHLGVED
ncbi:NAD(P)/FAD-dependent oxidoreductase [Actinomyces vulturis]|uniref:NAD(P)/FAD-dependent oxidoreductase n=1 Tax=Actinomyces vulturis TaxID=1857645 RepID=UPI00082DCFE2|nr:FAD-dependent oxidoreductase [Actinomyces vulturis]